MAPSPKISVCIPMYNAALFIKDCINSVLSQSFQDFDGECTNPECSNQCTINYCGPTTPTTPTIGPSGSPTPTVTTMCIGF